MSMAEDTRKRTDFSSDFPSNPPRESGGDPLAELARLIGQSDPFIDGAKRAGARKPSDFNAGPAPEWLARPASTEHDDYERAARRLRPARARSLRRADRQRRAPIVRRAALPKRGMTIVTRRLGRMTRTPIRPRCRALSGRRYVSRTTAATASRGRPATMRPTITTVATFRRRATTVCCLRASAAAC